MLGDNYNSFALKIISGPDALDVFQGHLFDIHSQLALPHPFVNLLNRLAYPLRLQPIRRAHEFQARGAQSGRRQPDALAGHFAARGSRVAAISLSDEQLAWARAHHPAVEFRKQDYRDAGRDRGGQYDAIVSVEMVEALGREYWPAFMDCIARNLKPGGRAALQYIAMRDDLFEAYARNADFIQAYVFPGGLLIKASARMVRSNSCRLPRGERACGCAQYSSNTAASATARLAP